MATILPHSELLRRAVSYVNDTRIDSPERKLASIIDEAAMRFNLSPLDGEALQRLFSSDTALSAQKAEAEAKR